MTCSIDRSGVFSVISFGAEREIIGWCESPMPGSRFVVPDYVKTEVLAMVVFVVGKVIEQHAAIHLLHVFAVLGYVARERKKI